MSSETAEARRHVRHEVDRLERKLARRLAATASRLSTVSLVPAGDDLSAGSRPACLYRDAEGNRYFFKAATPEHVAAEELAYAVRRLGDRPAIPVVARTLELPGVGAVEGMLQPFVAHAEGRLPAEPLEWSLLQREVMLREHPWEWLLANLDTHVDQYILVGPSRYPLNVDWDHALLDIDVVELTRFTKRSLTVAPVRNLLYEEHVYGRLRLDFHGQRHEAARAMEIPDAAIGAVVDRYCQTLGIDGDTLRHKLLERKSDLRRTFDRMIIGMRLERLELRGAAPPWQRFATIVKDRWQRLVISVLHDRIVRRVLNLQKAVLARRLGTRSSS